LQKENVVIGIVNPGFFKYVCTETGYKENALARYIINSGNEALIVMSEKRFKLRHERPASLSAFAGRAIWK